MESFAFSYGLSDLRAQASRAISVIAKRAYDTNGKSIFDRVTLSSIEDALLDDFFTNAFETVAASLGRKVTAYTYDYSTFSLTIICEAATVEALDKTIADFCVNEVIAQYMTSYYPNQAEPYLEAAKGLIAVMISICYTKQVPGSSLSDYSAINFNSSYSI